MTENNWRNVLADVRASKQELKEYGSMMTQYEKMVIQREIDARTAAAYPVVAGGIIGEWKAVIKKFQDGGQQVDRETRKEIQRWDMPKLAGEMNAIGMLVDTAAKAGVDPFGGPSPAVALETIYSEAVQSGDLHRQRAALEVLRGSLPKFAGYPVEIRQEVNRLAKQAERELEGMRTTPEIQQAHEAQSQAADELFNKRQELINVGQEIDNYDPTSVYAGSVIARALRTVGVKNHEIQIYADDSVEVTGVLPVREI